MVPIIVIILLFSIKWQCKTISFEYYIRFFHIFIFKGLCEDGKLFTLPVSNDTFCFVRKALGEKSWDEADEMCKTGGYDGLLELRYEDDATYMAKMIYCGAESVRNYQIGILIKEKSVDIAFLKIER